MSCGKVIVFGGTGYFGRLLTEDLVLYSACDITVASRHPPHSERFRTVVADLADRKSLERSLHDVEVAICAAGPYQRLPTLLCELCIDRGIHYIDLADDRKFVGKIRGLAASRKCESAICT